MVYAVLERVKFILIIMLQTAFIHSNRGYVS